MIFTKMQGCGNDYVYVDCTDGLQIEDEAQVAQKVSDRHFGIGSDGLILIKKGRVADFEMVMYNADGSRSQMCGNGIRCVAKYVYDKYCRFLHYISKKQESLLLDTCIVISIILVIFRHSSRRIF